MDYKAGMILSPPEHEHHRALKPRKIIAVDEEGVTGYTV